MYKSVRETASSKDDILSLFNEIAESLRKASSGIKS
jgi:hypothetical protein